MENITLNGKIRVSLQQSPERINIMHMIDALNPGGAERVAVNIANLLPTERFHSCLCTTRRDGKLEKDVAVYVDRLRLGRKSLLDWQALRKLTRFIREKRIDIVHAHSSSIFTVFFASFFPPYPRILWHDHFGPQALKGRSVILYRLVGMRIHGVVAVNTSLAEWAKVSMRMREENVWYVPNFVCAPKSNKKAKGLPGSTGYRIVCTANFHPPKDHLTLIRAMAIIARKVPKAHLILLGAPFNSVYMENVEKEILQQGLNNNISLLGPQEEVYPILLSSDIAVLSSEAEGFPLTLLEYGMSGLPVVSSDVGQCAEILESGDAGILIPPGDVKQMAQAVLSLLLDLEKRETLSRKFQQRVNDKYGQERIITKFTDIYDSIYNVPSSE